MLTDILLFLLQDTGDGSVSGLMPAVIIREVRIVTQKTNFTCFCMGVKLGLLHLGEDRWYVETGC
jgi:hypothetical protein